jgi:AbrB family looped-hinge helix DNA binding protein
MILSRISAKGQVTLPRKVRQTLQVKPGDQVEFVLKQDTVVLQPLTASSARALGGSLRRYARTRPAEPARGVARKETTRAAAQEG